jgi:glutamate-1-semialdehyde 2,1-aminomutase
VAQYWEFTDTDTACAAKLRALVGEQIFDAHAHVYALPEGWSGTGLLAGGPAEASPDVWRRHLVNTFGPKHLTGALFMPYPGLGDVTSANDLLATWLKSEPTSRGLMLAPPDLPEASLHGTLASDGIVGFKPYHVYSPSKPTFDAPLSEWLAERFWRLADEGGLVITIHLVRPGALADPENLDELLRMCRRYSNARIVLAHAARGFHAPNTVNAISRLRGLENVWFDSAAICEAEPLLAILDEFGPRRLLWGSDFPVSEGRGRCVTLGDQFTWVATNAVDTKEGSPGCRPLPVGLESLRALLTATKQFGLSADDLRDIFHDNAHRLLDLPLPAKPDVQELYARARKRMPGGTQLLSKRPEMFAPKQWPAYFREARGCEVWDTDGHHFYDFSYNGIGSCLLGFRDPDVTAAVRRRINLGSMCTLNPSEELELADLLCELHPWAECARFARTGGEIAAVAVRIARATTGRDHIAVCGYHGWHDWYLAANLGNSETLAELLLPGLDPDGVPAALNGTTLTFPFDDIQAFDRVLAERGDELAAIVMEPCRHHAPAPGFLEHIRTETAKRGILLIFDEITIGWRLAIGGAHMILDVQPDLAIFAKALGNGHPIAAVIGTAPAMEGAQHSFISSTYWTESVGPAAALATIAKMQRVSLPEHLAHVGRRIKSSWQTHAQAHAVPIEIEAGFDCMSHIRFVHEQANELRTLYTQLLLGRGFLASAGVYPTLALTDDILDRFDDALDPVFKELGEAIRQDNIVERLRGPAAHTGFRRLVD